MNVPPAIVPDSYLRLADGSVQFQINASGASQATVQTSTDLIQWAALQTVPILNNSGSFTDPDAAKYTARFSHAKQLRNRFIAEASH